MYNVKNQCIDICVTPNHNLYVREQGKNIYKFKKPEEIFKKYWYRYKTTSKWIGENKVMFTIPPVNRGQFGLSEPLYVNMDEWLKFFGFYIAEGWVTNGKTAKYIIGMRNNNRILLDELKTTLEKLGFAPYYHGETILELSNKQLYTYLLQFGKSYEKYIPEEIKSLSSKQLKILL